MLWNRNKISNKLRILTDDYLDQVQSDWFNNSHPRVNSQALIPVLNEWFQSTRVNDFQGWSSLPCIDITMGNTHYIESLVARNGWNGFQILNEEYAYYSFNGKWGVEVGALESNKPLIITLPHFKWADIRPEWPDVLRECEQKNIDIHIDMAWATLGRNINIDFSHPNIQSVGMSISKYSMQWNRIGIRYSKQRTMDSITMFNHYYQPATNIGLSSCGAYAISRIPRDYGWNVYGSSHTDICNSLGFKETNLVHVVKTADTSETLGISGLLKDVFPAKNQP
jgi:hypothetical protein